MDAEGSSQSQLRFPDAVARDNSNSSAPSAQVSESNKQINLFAKIPSCCLLNEFQQYKAHLQFCDSFSFDFGVYNV